MNVGISSIQTYRHVIFSVFFLTAFGITAQAGQVSDPPAGQGLWAENQVHVAGDSASKPPETIDTPAPARDQQQALPSYEPTPTHSSPTDTVTQKEREEEFSFGEMTIPLSYGFEKSPVQIHLFMNTALWNFGSQAHGDYANTGNTNFAGRPLFITYSGYVNVSCQINRRLYAEAEFELYRGQQGEFKVTRLRHVWSPSANFRLTLGRDFPAIGIPDYAYYPPSQYRLFAMAPYVYWRILRQTGWWDSGVHLSGALPLKFIGAKSGLNWAVSIINGPGDQHLKGKTLVDLVKPNAEGYMYEDFHENARQPWDNNKNKYLCYRASFSPIPRLEIGGSHANGKYDKNDRYGAAYSFAHFMYGGDRLTVVNEFGQIKIEVNPDNMKLAGVNDVNGTFGHTQVTQYSYYLSFGYQIIKERYVNFFEPVFRYEFIDMWKEDRTNKNDRRLIWLGFRLSPERFWTIKAGYSWQTELTGPKLANDGYILESVVEF